MDHTVKMASYVGKGKYFRAYDHIIEVVYFKDNRFHCSRNKNSHYCNILSTKDRNCPRKQVIMYHAKYNNDECKCGHRCEICPIMYLSERLLKDHYISNHKSEYFNKYKEDTEKFEEQHPEYYKKSVGTFKCHHCEENFTTLLNSNEHMKEVHSDKMKYKLIHIKREEITCEKCGFISISRKALKRHQECKNETSCKNPACGYIFKKGCKLNQHIQEVHKDFRCKELGCNNEYSDQSELNRH
uniref:C2H2-type domain-containing protein n=1 Tax=Strongyloides venezuelensis TaxID=75913 RepID=A0A0K0G0D0_STRVS